MCEDVWTPPAFQCALTLPRVWEEDFISDFPLSSSGAPPYIKGLEINNSRPAFVQLDCQKRGIKKYLTHGYEFSKHLQNKDKRIKELLTSTAHTTSSNQVFWCHRSDHCGKPSLITIISYISLCFLSFSGISNRKYMEIPTLKIFTSCWWYQWAHYAVSWKCYSSPCFGLWI